FSLYEDLTVEENLVFFATVFGTTVQENYHLVREVFQQLEPFKKRPAGKLSGGMKQKLALSCALVHKPRLLVLDEPTTGVDAVSRSDFWHMLQKLKDAGITILVSTPYMDEASQCDRVALVQKGHLLDVATPSDVKNGFRGRLFGVSGENLYGLIQSCRGFEKVFSVYPFGRELHLVFKDGADQRQALTSYLQSRGFRDFSIEEIQPGVEDRFMALMQDVDQIEESE
ncbi:MAG: ATP-binding cassette domain-containing protein, partial [Marinilabiliaceae bacterium]